MNTIEYVGWVNQMNTTRKDKRLPMGLGNLEHAESGVPFIRDCTGKPFNVNEPTACLWENCNGKKDINEITKAVRDSMGLGIESHQLKSAVSRSIDMLADEGLLDFVKPRLADSGPRRYEL